MAAPRSVGPALRRLSTLQERGGLARTLLCLPPAPGGPSHEHLPSTTTRVPGHHHGQRDRLCSVTAACRRTARRAPSVRRRLCDESGTTCVPDDLHDGGAHARVRAAGLRRSVARATTSVACSHDSPFESTRVLLVPEPLVAFARRRSGGLQPSAELHSPEWTRRNRAAETSSSREYISRPRRTA